MGQENTESTWKDVTPGELISETEVTDCATRLERLTADWLDDNVQYFDLWEWEGPKEKFWRNKAFNEVSVYLLNALDHGEHNHVPALEDLVIERANEQQFAQFMLRNQRKFHHFAYPPIYARCVDALNADVEAALEQVAENGEFWCCERIPYRLLEYCFLCRMVGVQFKHVEDDIVEMSLLNHQPNIAISNYFDAYSLTHDVMFTQYDKLFYHNIDDNIIPTTNGSYDISVVLRGLILRFMAKDNPDVALELVLSGILKKQISREMVRLVLSWVSEKTQTVDYVPGPPKGSMTALFSPKLMREEEEPWRYEYKNEEEKIWARNYHTNLVAGMTARVLKRDWHKLDNWQMQHSVEEHSFRQDIMHLGQLLKSLGEYDLESGSQQMIEVAESPVTTEFSFVFQEAVDFLENQRTHDGEFGFWTEEEIIYINNDNTEESFHNKLVKPVSDSCQKALDAVESCSQ